MTQRAAPNQTEASLRARAAEEERAKVHKNASARTFSSEPLRTLIPKAIAAADRGQAVEIQLADGSWLHEGQIRQLAQCWGLGKPGVQ